MLHKGRSIAVWDWVNLERELLALFGGHEVLMTKSQRELLAGLKVSKSVGIGVGGPTCFGIEIVCEYAGDLANGAMSVSIRIGWREIDPDLIAG